MNKLEEIKRKLEWYSYHGDISGNEVEGDVEYLLAKLEIAEKALEKAFADNGFVYLREALQQIRE